MFRAVTAHSDDIDTGDAIDAVLADCTHQLGTDEPRAGLLFSANEYEHGEILDRILDLYPDLQLIGCTTDGEMSGAGGFSEDGISLMLLCSDEVRFAAACGRNAGAQPQQAAREAVGAAGVLLDGPARLALVLPDGLTTSAYQVLEAFEQSLGNSIAVVGGMSADRVGGAKSSYSTYQFCGREVLSDCVPLLLLGGSLRYSVGVESGWQPIGRKMTVTRATGNQLHELDGRPAFELYTHYLGEILNEDLSGLGCYPLAIYESGLERFYLRVPRSADPEDGSIEFLGEIPVGAEVQITQAIRDSVMDGVDASARAARQAYPGKAPAAAMLFSCTGRKIALGTRTAEEVARATRNLPADLPVCGFYTFGEIGPVADRRRARYHNTTFVTLLMGSQ